MDFIAWKAVSSDLIGWNPVSRDLMAWDPDSRDLNIQWRKKSISVGKKTYFLPHEL
jgi:hypothetical protein